MLGENINQRNRGMYLVITESVPPYAVGKFTGTTIEILKTKNEINRLSDFERYRKLVEGCVNVEDMEINTSKTNKIDKFDQEDFEEIFDIYGINNHPKVDMIK